MALIHDKYPEDALIHADTDGSATDTVTKDIADILIKYPGGNSDTKWLPTGKHCKNCKAEMDVFM